MADGAKGTTDIMHYPGAIEPFGKVGSE
jgi:hypothetical protein